MASPFWMNEESSNLRGIVCGIEESVFTVGAVIAAIRSLALAPSTAADELARFSLNDEIRLILYELCVESKPVAERGFQLRRCVGLRHQSTDRMRNEAMQSI